MGEIVVGIDGSENSHLALRWAVDEARLRASTLRVIHSWTFPAPVPGPDGLRHVDLEAAAEKVVDEAIAAVGDTSGVEITKEIAPEAPARAVIKASEGSELVVVGSRGLGGFTGLLLGSVAQQVAHHARCPVVLVPHPRAAS